MTDRKTCGDCPWTCQGNTGPEYRYCSIFNIDMYHGDPECNRRRALRVMRDEIKRLKKYELQANQLAALTKGMTVDQITIAGWKEFHKDD